MPDDLKKSGARRRKRATKQREQDYQVIKKASVASGRETEDSKKPGRAGKTQGPAVIPDTDSAG